jgi:tetratricopeptide (TPR) repeat protein
MRHFGIYSLRMKENATNCAGLRLDQQRTLWLSIFLILTLFSSVGLSQSESSARSSALNADINYRRRELENDPKNAEARAQLAVALERKKDYSGMVEILEGHKDKVGRTGLVLLSRAYSRLGRSADEIAVLELAKARFPKDIHLQTLLAASLGRAGRKDASIEAFYKAKEANPKYIPAYEGLLVELVKSESRQEARDLLEDMMKKFGKKGRWVSELCSLYAADAFLEKAVETCAQGLKKDSSNPMNAVHLAATYREQGEAEKAKKVLVSAATRIKNPNRYRPHSETISRKRKILSMPTAGTKRERSQIPLAIPLNLDLRRPRLSSKKWMTVSPPSRPPVKSIEPRFANFKVP